MSPSNLTVRLAVPGIVAYLTSLAQVGGAGETRGDCDLCGCLDEALHEGACACCDARLTLASQAAGIPAHDTATGPHPYTVELAQRVRGTLGARVSLPGVTLLADAIEDAFRLIARDLSAGREVHLHHIGDLLLANDGQGPDLGCMPDRDLLAGYRRTWGGL